MGFGFETGFGGFGSGFGGSFGSTGGYWEKKKKEESLRDLINSIAPPPEYTDEVKQSLLSRATQEGLGAVGAFGNLLDVGGSSVRSALAGKSPVAHLSNPLSGEGKVWGRDLTTKWGWTKPNKETGLTPFADPAEFGRDVLGFGVEVLTDPLTYLTLGTAPLLKGIGGLSKAGRSIHKLGLLDEAADLATRKYGRRIGRHEARHLLKPQDYIDELSTLSQKFPEIGEQLARIPRGQRGQRLGGGMNIDIPFLGPIGPPISPTFGYASKGLDKVNFLMNKTLPGRMWSKSFDWSARNFGGAAEQAMARRLTRYADNKRNYAAKPLHNYYDTYSESQRAFADAFGDEIARRQAGQAPLAGFRVGDVVDHADLPVQARVIGSDQGELLVSAYNQETRAFATHNIDPSAATRVGKAGSKLANAERDLLVNKAHDSVWRLATELDSKAAKGYGGGGLARGLDEFQMGDVIDEFGAGGLDISTLPAAQSTKLHDVFNESVEALEDLAAHNYKDNVNKGLRIGELKETMVNGRPEGIQHVPRYINQQALDRLEETARTGGVSRKTSALDSPLEEQRIAQEFTATPGTAKGRTAATRHIPTTILNRMYRDKQIAHLPDVSAIANYIKTNPDYQKYLTASWNPNAASVFHAVDEHAKALAESVMRHRGDSIYSATMIDDLMKYNDELTRSSATLDAVHETLAQDIMLGSRGTPQPGGEALANVMSRAGMEVNLDKATGLYSGRALEHLSDVLKKGTSPAELNALARTQISPEVAKAITATKMIRTHSDEVSTFLKMYDKWQNFFKSNVTLPFASFFMRNGVSGQFVNLTSGDLVNPADIASYMREFARADRLAKGATRAGDKELLREIHSLGFVGGRTHFDDVKAIGRYLDPKDMFAVAPGSRPTLGLGVISVKHWKGKMKEASEHVKQNPSIMKSIMSSADQAPGRAGIIGGSAGGLRQVHHAWLASGSKVNAGVEWMNRVPMYLYLRRKGYGPSAAARRVRELQFDYSELSKFEKGGMRRAVPFYTFQRKMAPLFARTILERPGGALAQVIKESARVAGTGGHILPEYITQNLAIPLGETEEGGASYLTGFGLAHENPLSYMSDLAALGRGDVPEFLRGAYRHGMSQINPYAKTALEVLQDESFFQKGHGGRGRKMSEMQPPLGRTISNVMASLDDWNILKSKGGLRRPPTEWGEYLGGKAGFPRLGRSLGILGEAAIGGSPVSRYLSVARGLFDPRPEKTALMKGLNVFTGVKATALSPEQLAAVERDTLAEQVSSSRFGRTLSLPSVDRATLIKYRALGKISEEDFNYYLAIQSNFNASAKAKRGRTSEGDSERMAEMRRYQSMISKQLL